MKHLNPIQYREQIALRLKSELHLNRFEAVDYLRGSEDLIASSWRNFVDVDEVVSQIIEKTLVL